MDKQEEDSGKPEFRVTEKLIRSKIIDVKFTILEDGKTTICNLYLQNGFTVRGESACVDPKNFNKDMGEKISFSNAFDKVWLLEGYLMQESKYRWGFVLGETPEQSSIAKKFLEF